MRPALALLCAVSALAGSAQSRPPPPPAGLSPTLRTLVETERAFARMSVARNRRDAFLAFFSDDAIFFVPAPANAKELIRAWPAGESYKLDWEPRYGDVAETADLGYTTGPFQRTAIGANGNLVGTGWYFTVWKKQGDGTWKVAIDAGIQTSTDPPVVPLREFPFERRGAASATVGGGSGSVLAADGALCAAIASTSIARALSAAGDTATLVYRDGNLPMSGDAVLARFFAAHPGRMTCEPLKEEMSRAADLGYTYGTYSIDRTTKESGYYLRVWRRRAGSWKLAADLTIPGQ